MRSVFFPCLMLAFVLPFRVFSETEEASSVTNLSKSIPFSDETTGVVFPAKIGLFTKIEVRKNNNPFFGTLIRYSGTFGTSADIYIYSLTATPAEVSLKSAMEHFAQVKESIMALASKAPGLGQITLEEEYILQSGNQEVGRRAVFRFDMDGEEFTSELIIFPYGDRVVKFRITSPTESTAAGKAAAEFLRTVTDSFFKGSAVQYIQVPRPKAPPAP